MVSIANLSLSTDSGLVPLPRWVWGLRYMCLCALA
jgi:hypothetical protein